MKDLHAILFNDAIDLKLEDGNTEPRTGQDHRYPEQK
jgi:hypothetical protein